MMEYEFRTIVEWIGEPTSPGKRQRARFDTPYRKTLLLLQRELKNLSAKQVVIQSYHEPHQIRNDGLIRSDARQPSSPGVIVSFKSKHGPLSYPCDTFTKWEDNLRAIALALEALRTVDRYGVTKTGEQYRGWTALPPATSKTIREIAAEFLSTHSGSGVEVVLRNKFFLEQAYKAAARKLHPDNKETGGNELFQELQEMMKILRQDYIDAAARGDCSL